MICAGLHYRLTWVPARCHAQPEAFARVCSLTRLTADATGDVRVRGVSVV
jgi:hypothetical protein